MDFAAVLQRIGDGLDRSGHRFALIGGHGLAAYGIVRATLDLDLLLPAAAQEQVLRLMKELGYEELHVSPGYSNHLHPDPQNGRVDFVYVGKNTSAKLFAAARRMEGPGGTTVLVPRAEHLAAMKVLAIKNDPSRRNQELADVQSLLQVHGVDHEEIRGAFARYGLLGYWDEIT